jgi:hypothetical protein
MVEYTIPGMKNDTAERVTTLLQDRLNSLSDLALTLKHVHWNVTGPSFIAVHTMLDPQVDAVRAMVDETAERIATLGASPVRQDAVRLDVRARAARARTFADRGDLRWPGPCGALPGSPRGILRRVNERDSPTKFQGTGH